ncbi:MAG: hypothetical protein IPI91_20905 [Flavobacteriales bacterium]|nr:hypothetical protein [Flavobacteriales bacterium]
MQVSLHRSCHFHFNAFVQKHALNTNGNGHFKMWGAVIYFFCFPVKSLIIYLNLALLITGGDGWSLG